MMRGIVDMLGAATSQPFVERIGWVLFHSLWQFGILAIMAWLAILLLHRQAASKRYLVLASVMLGSVIAPLITWYFVGTSLLGGNRPSISSIDSRAATNEAKPSAHESQKSQELNNAEVDPTTPESLNTDDSAKAAKEEVTLPSSGNWLIAESRVNPFVNAVQPWLSTSVTVWVLGVLVFSFRPILSWLTIRGLLASGSTEVDRSIVESLAKLKKILRVRRSVRVMKSSLIHTPIVVGVVRSVILLPVSLLSNLPVAQVEAILAHELAHVKRYDYLVNLLQTIGETLFFYHPAIWWLSNRIRIERENCCDDLVVAALCNRIDYGKALLAVEEHLGMASTLALGARDGSLLARVQRIAGMSSKSRSADGTSLAAQFTAGILFIGIVSLFVSRLFAQGDDNMEAFGPVSHGLQLRLVVLASEVDDEAPDFQKTAKAFVHSGEMTFGVQIKNVSDHVITLAGVRYGDNFALETQGKLNTAMLAPHWFDFEFTDRDGKPLTRPQREFFQGWSVAESASTHALAPGESLIEVLRPAQFDAPMDFDLSPGKYNLRVRYHGPSETIRDRIRKHWPDNPILNAWPHEVESNSVGFFVEEASHRMPVESLRWGTPVEGLQAALEFRVPEKVIGNPVEEPGVPVGSPLSVIFHLRNVSDKPITFISETNRQGDTIHVKDESGKEVEVPNVFFTGWPIDVLWKLLPGETAQLKPLAPGVAALDQPGRYSIRYTVRFNSRIQEDEQGKITFPRPGDFDKEVDTGETTLVLHEVKKEVSANGEIHGRLVDDVTGEPIRGATVACGAVLNDSRTGGGSSATTDSMGNYRLRVPSPGIYNVWVKDHRGVSGTAAADDGVLVEAGEVSKSELRWSDGRWIEGKVVDPRGNPVGQIAVSVYSAARPQSGGVQSVRTKDDGTFSMLVPPGRVYLYSREQPSREQAKPVDLGLDAEAFIDVSASQKSDPVTLVLGTTSKDRSSDWLKKSTPGTRILSHENKAGIRGVVVDVEGKPLADVKVFKEDGEVVTTDSKGEFRYALDKGTQCVMHAFLSGYHLWFGTPTAGDELKMVMEKKGKLVANHQQIPEIILPDSLNVMAVAFSADSLRLSSVAMKDDVTIRTWSVANRKLENEVKLDRSMDGAAPLHGNQFLMSNLRLSPDLKRVVGSVLGKIRIWNAEDGKLLQTLSNPGNNGSEVNPRGIAMAADLGTIAAGLGSGGLSRSFHGDCDIAVWEGEEHSRINKMTHPAAVQITSLAISADGSLLASGSQSGTTCVFDLDEGQSIYCLVNSNGDRKHPDATVSDASANQVVCLAFSPDGKTLAIGDLLGVKLIDASSGDVIHELESPFRFGMSGLVFSSDGKLLARTATDKTVPIWSTESGKLIAELPTEAHDGAFSKDGNWFATGFSDDKQALSIWKMVDGKPVSIPK